MGGREYCRSGALGQITEAGDMRTRHHQQVTRIERSDVEERQDRVVVDVQLTRWQAPVMIAQNGQSAGM
jgi:hypothetical protein